MTRLQARDITVWRGGRLVLDAVSLAVPAGRLVGLIGPNGAGKTTLLRVLAGLARADQGSVRLDDAILAHMPRRRLGRTLAYLPQRGAVEWPLTVRRLVLLGRLPHGTPWGGISTADRDAVAQAMHRLGVADLAERSVATLSGGEVARVLLARAVAVGAPILLVDEPIAALDPYYQLQVMELLRAEARGGTAVVAVLHDLALAARFCDDLVLLSEGRVLAQGAAAEVLVPEAIGHAYRVTAWQGEHAGQRIVVPWQRLAADGAEPDYQDRTGPQSTWRKSEDG